MTDPTADLSNSAVINPTECGRLSTLLSPSANRGDYTKVTYLHAKDEQIRYDVSAIGSVQRWQTFRSKLGVAQGFGRTDFMQVSAFSALTVSLYRRPSTGPISIDPIPPDHLGSAGTPTLLSAIGFTTCARHSGECGAESVAVIAFVASTSSCTIIPSRPAILRTERRQRFAWTRIVLIEPDHIEARNLNRIYGATREDAEAEVNKAVMMQRHISNIIMLFSVGL